MMGSVKIMEKKTYKIPEVEITKFEAEDVIAGSK